MNGDLSARLSRFAAVARPPDIAVPGEHLLLRYQVTLYNTRSRSGIV